MDNGSAVPAWDRDRVVWADADSRSGAERNGYAAIYLIILPRHRRAYHQFYGMVDPGGDRDCCFTIAWRCHVRLYGQEAIRLCEEYRDFQSSEFPENSEDWMLSGIWG